MRPSAAEGGRTKLLENREPHMAQGEPSISAGICSPKVSLCREGKALTGGTAVVGTWFQISSYVTFFLKEPGKPEVKETVWRWVGNPLSAQRAGIRGSSVKVPGEKAA